MYHLRFTSLQKFFARFRRSTEGVTAIEFAFIAPVLVLLIMGTLEISLMMYAQSLLEGASFQSSRTGKTGYTASGLTQQETIINTINKRAGILMDTSKLSVIAKSYNSFSDVEQPEPFTDNNGNGTRDWNENYTDVNGNAQYDEDMGIAGYGSGGSIIMYTISYDWPISTPMLRPIFGTTHELVATTVVKNEPY